jgi:hypothetical protein
MEIRTKKTLTGSGAHKLDIPTTSRRKISTVSVELLDINLNDKESVLLVTHAARKDYEAVARLLQDPLKSFAFGPSFPARPDKLHMAQSICSQKVYPRKIYSSL